MPTWFGLFEGPRPPRIGKHRYGWKGHATASLKRRRRKRNIAFASRRRNRR